MPGLEGKVALVTGASRGIERAIAIRLGREAASVVVNYSGIAEAAREAVTAVERAGGKAVAVRADVGQVAEVVRLFDESIAPVR
jgi:3-oxoacyl-[acyl-carrier protein] reductase